ncbi:P-loop containing nucleoside triphosphate hydrolase [Vibrio phage 1.244.A._10N.261.54.C3]|nr:P-loop containing nucleoside triphosphate hydrolase [Vibrio phage 1.244.A._10N.261.54.C3]AUR98646.1 P-loop containing nucleoside triphosphate hydrolase [Vibrio phage 1.255.O._10N.286.45.F1]
MSYEIYCEQINARSMRIYCEEECVHMELNDFFQYDDPNFQPNRWSKWDGKVRLYDRHSGKLDVGLLEYLVKFCSINKYPLEIDPRLKQMRRIDMDDVHEYCDSLNLSRSDDGDYVSCVPYDYQYYGVERALKLRRAVLLADTGAGKSLMQYILTRFYIEEYEALHNRPAKVLLLVPSVMLVNQMQADFKEYSQFNGWDVEKHVHGISAGCSKLTRKNVVVSTWQSIQDEAADYFDQFTHLITDEVHGASASKISYICNNCINCYDRAGLTGTLHEEEMNKLQVQAHFGPIMNVADTKLLKKLGQASETLVTMMNLDYSVSDRQFASKLDYMGEIDFITKHPQRNKLISALASTLTGNTLMLFDRRDHIDAVYELIKDQGNVHIINGDVNGDVREVIKAALENCKKRISLDFGSDFIEVDFDDIFTTKSGDKRAIDLKVGDVTEEHGKVCKTKELRGATLLATFGCVSTGVSIKNLHNLVFCHPSKSIIRVLQSLGRLLRRHKSKEVAMIYDLVDNLKIAGGDANHAVRHAMKRYGFYTNKGHKMRTKRYPISVDLPDGLRQDVGQASRRRIAMKASRDNNK